MRRRPGGPRRRPTTRANATAAPTTPAATMWWDRTWPTGNAAAWWATAATHPRSSRVGTWIAAARRPSASPGTRPATRPAVSPHIITGPAAGTASGFATNAASGAPPNTATSTGATPTCAASVTDTASTSGRGPRRRRAMRGASTTMLADAATDSWNPTEWTSIGSTSTSAVTARPRSRMLLASRPSVAASAARLAIADARRTDGSKRVSSAKNAIVARVAPRRARRPIRRRAGATIASTKATFWPETASRWLRPDARKSAVTAAGCSRWSPRTNPANRDLCSGSSDDAPRMSVRRRAFATRLTGGPGAHACTAPIDRRPTMCRSRSHWVPGVSGAVCPARSNRSPANRGASTRADAPRAVAS